MRTGIVGVLILVAASTGWGQGPPAHSFAIGAGYLRQYGGGGIGLHAEYNWHLSPRLAVGLPVRLGWSSVGANPGKRRSFMVGGQVRLMAPARPGQASPFIGAAVLAISSSVPDVASVYAPGTVAANDAVGTEWGYGMALDAGVELARTGKVGLRLDASAIYQYVYQNNSDVSWTLGASIVF